jgi:hypothetical protein
VRATTAICVSWRHASLVTRGGACSACLSYGERPAQASAAVGLTESACRGFKSNADLLMQPFGLPSTWQWGNYTSVLQSAAFWRQLRELDQAAAIDGCSPARFFVRVLLPLMRPALASVAVLTIAGAKHRDTLHAAAGHHAVPRAVRHRLRSRAGIRLAGIGANNHLLPVCRAADCGWADRRGGERLMTRALAVVETRHIPRECVNDVLNSSRIST